MGSKRTLKKVVRNVARRAKPALLRFGAESVLAIQGLADAKSATDEKLSSRDKFRLLGDLLEARAKQTGLELVRSEIDLLGAYLVRAAKHENIPPDEVSDTADLDDGELAET